MGILYTTLSRSDQRELLRNVIERVVVNHEGEIARVDLLPPFSYLRDVCDRVRGGEGVSSQTQAESKTDDASATCSSKVLECELGRTSIEHFQGCTTSEFLHLIGFSQSAMLSQLMR